MYRVGEGSRHRRREGRERERRHDRCDAFSHFVAYLLLFGGQSSPSDFNLIFHRERLQHESRVENRVHGGVKGGIHVTPAHCAGRARLGGQAGKDWLEQAPTEAEGASAG